MEVEIWTLQRKNFTPKYRIIPRAVGGANGQVERRALNPTPRPIKFQITRSRSGIVCRIASSRVQNERTRRIATFDAPFQKNCSRSGDFEASKKKWGRVGGKKREAGATKIERRDFPAEQFQVRPKVIQLLIAHGRVRVIQPARPEVTFIFRERPRLLWKESARSDFMETLVQSYGTECCTHSSGLY